MPKKYSACVLFVCSISFLYGQIPARQGWWKFDDTANPVKAEIGSALVLTGTHQITAGPEAVNGAVKINGGSYYTMKHQMDSNGGGELVNEYTIQIDFRVSNSGEWKTFFQTDMSNTNDGDCFIDAVGHIGTQMTGYTSYAVNPKEWYRFVLTVKNGTQHIAYLDGQMVKAGSPPSIDGRFALDSLLLLFADNDGDDAEIECAEVAIWNSALSSRDIAALGGFGHDVSVPPIPIIPYLQTPTSSSVFVCWHDTSSVGTRVEYGTTASPNTVVTGSSELIAMPYRWHTVRLSGLTPNTEYYYRAKSGSNSSAVFKFKTQPAVGYSGKIRFLLLSDTHNPDTSKPMKVITAAREKITELYGADIQNQINAVLHSGDLVLFGKNVDEYERLYFSPMSVLSSSIPFLTVPGNHDRPDNGRDGDAGRNYYAYMQYDSISLIVSPNLPSERFWSVRFANTLVIGLNSNIASTLGNTQKNLLDHKLAEAEADSTIDFVMCLSHHMPYTELWNEAIAYDPGPNYMKDAILPILQKYPKVVQLTYGHTHGYERGTVESQTDRGDFRIVCNGGGGGEIDRWGAFENIDYANIHVSYDHFFYHIVEIDVEKKTFTGSMYSLGNTEKPHDHQVLDMWYRKILQPAPFTPSVSSPTILEHTVVFNSSPISGPDSLMTVRMQIAYDTSFTQIEVDTMVNWKNVYGRNEQFDPVDKNAGIDLTRVQIPKSGLVEGKPFYYRVRYRDHNLRWSNWSNRSNGVIRAAKVQALPTSYRIEQNLLNPCQPLSAFDYQSPANSGTTTAMINVLGNINDRSVGRNGICRVS